MNLFASLLHYGLPFIVVLTPLIFVHELGHFLVARWNKVRVEVFSIGFGRELFGWYDRHGTRWKVSAVPLGGYVKMFGQGMPDLVEAPAEVATPALPLSAADEAVSFNHKRLWQRALIVAAGPAANFLFAIVITAVVFATFGQQLTATVIGEVKAGSAAEAAGLKSGDKLLTANGQHIRRFEDLAALVSVGLGEPLKLQIRRGDVRRGDQVMDIDAQPKIIEVTDIFGNVHRIGRLGVGASGRAEVVHYDPATALWVATVETYRTGSDMLKSVGQMVTGVRPPSEVGGVLSIAQMSGDVFSQGLWATISFAVLISINLGLINLFPIPLLDGGHLLFYAFEAVSGRRIGPRTEEWGMRVGLALVLSLMLFAAWNDLVRIGVIRFITNLFA
jgi:regulator of sigma E protease